MNPILFFFLCFALGFTASEVVTRATDGMNHGAAAFISMLSGMVLAVLVLQLSRTVSK